MDELRQWHLPSPFLLTFRKTWKDKPVFVLNFFFNCFTKTNKLKWESDIKLVGSQCLIVCVLLPFRWDWLNNTGWVWFIIMLCIYKFVTNNDGRKQWCWMPWLKPLRWAKSEWKTWKSIFQPAFGVCSTQTLAKIYNALQSFSANTFIIIL